MAKKKTHKTRAMELLESLGWTVADVERWIPGTRIKKDMFGFADLFAVHPDAGCLALQVTSAGGGKRGSDVMSRVRNVLDAADKVIVCLKAGCKVEVWGIRNVPTLDGKLVVARSFEYQGDELVAFEGSEVLPSIGECA